MVVERKAKQMRIACSRIPRRVQLPLVNGSADDACVKRSLACSACVCGQEEEHAQFTFSLISRFKRLLLLPCLASSCVFLG